MQHARTTRARGGRLLLGATLLVLLGVAGLGYRSARVGQEIIHPTRYRVSPTQVAAAHAALPGLEEVTLRTSDGLNLRAWFSPGTRRTAVVLVHGLWGNRASLEPEAAVLARHGYGVLLYDSRASGDSDGDVATFGDREQLDTRAAIDYVSQRPEIDPTRIGMLGFSVGGSTAAMSAVNDPRVRALILHATWTSLEREIRSNHRKFGPLSWWPILTVMRSAGVVPEHVTPLAHLATFAPRPLLMIAGGDDDDTPVPIMEQVFAAAGAPKALWVVPGANHGGCLAAAPAEYERRVIAFLDEAFPANGVHAAK